MSDFFYDHQVRRFVSQFVRAFSKFYVEYGKDQDGNTTLYRVPVRYADTNRQAASILHNNSENTLTTVPIMVCYIDALKYDRERIQNPTHVDSINIRQRAKDPVTGELTTQQRQGFTIDRLMPVPYKLTMKMEVWTTNFDQKLQILEQICTIFNPALEIQSTDNYVDWTSLSYILLQDINWTTRNIPIGTDDPIDIASLTFDLPIWITAPAKLKKLGVVQTIVASVYDAAGNLDQAIEDQSILTAHRQYFTPMGYNVIALNGQIRLIKKYGPVIGIGDNIAAPEAIGNPIDWEPLLTLIGSIKPGISLLQLRDPVTNNVIVGTIALNPADPTILLFNVDHDTVPNNSLPAVDSIIDPRKSSPGSGLPTPRTGVRYLILDSIGDKNTATVNQAAAWKNTDGSTTFANANDIIGWDGSRWDILFDSQKTKNTQYVTNTYTSIQYKWNGTEWIKSWEGYYDEGYWTIVI
jgi:hypothetical protein